MVGVSGGSKGCNTCRKRRVKCDEGKPQCLRCSRGGFECLGYERQLVWYHASTAPFPASATLPSPFRDAKGTLSMTRVIGPSIEVSLAAFQADFCYAYMFSNFVWRSYGALWLDQAAEGKLGSLAMESTKALAQANFGRANNESAIEREGVVIYGQCLRALAEDLSRTRLQVQGTKELLVPILVLLMHATAHCDRTGAAFHLKGILELLRLCGPEAFQEQPLLNAFEAARATLTMVGLFGRRRLFIDDISWRTVPWALDPASKTPQSKLLDILVTIPGILQDYATAEEAAVNVPHLYTKVAERVQEQLTTLFQWRRQWQASSGNLVSVDTGKPWLAHDTAHSIPDIPSSAGRLRFDKFVAAIEIMLYNATLMWLLVLLWRTDPEGARRRLQACAVAAIIANRTPMSASFEPLRRPGASVTVRDSAMEVVRVFEWVSRHHDLSKDASHLYLFPVGMAMSVLEHEPEGRGWAQVLLEKSPVTADYARTVNPMGFGSYLSLGALNGICPAEFLATQCSTGVY